MITEKMILEAMDCPKNPLMTVYRVCARMGLRQERSSQNIYRQVYRKMEKLVDSGELIVARGVRDPSVYLLVPRCLRGQGKR